MRNFCMKEIALIVFMFFKVPAIQTRSIEFQLLSTKIYKWESIILKRNKFFFKSFSADFEKNFLIAVSRTLYFFQLIISEFALYLDCW